MGEKKWSVVSGQWSVFSRHRRGLGRSLGVLCLMACLGVALRADTLIFKNGDELTGTLVRADAKGCVFASKMASDVTAPWDNIRELRTTTTFVVVTKGGEVYRGTLLVENDSLVVSSATAPPAFLGAPDVLMVVDPKTYTKEVLAHPRLWQSWRGQIVGGFSQVSATQSSTSYTTQLDLQRPVPKLSWLEQRSNTLLHFNGTYGKLSQPHTPTVRTSIFTAGLEQDQDISKRLFLFANTRFDHNDAQGLQLQQAYGGGIGWKVKTTSDTQLALRADLHWTRQRFLSTVNNNFLASSVTETLRQMLHKVIWTQSISITPSITHGVAYQMSGISAWAMPVYHSLSLNFTVVDAYLNNPQPGFLKNSLQYSTGLQINLH
ncbi:MAG: DUF481 domain-containing protein [Acidobacteria bacterium]|nr:MAG: DUF481 domain-containing protein [Acidobacteriota bacterium]